MERCNHCFESVPTSECHCEAVEVVVILPATTGDIGEVILPATTGDIGEKISAAHQSEKQHYYSNEIVVLYMLLSQTRHG